MALGETKRVPVSWSEKVMIGRNPGLTGEQAAAAHKLLVAVDPDVEFWCVSFRERATRMLSTIRPRFDVENRRVRRKTLGNGVSRFERGVSGPNKMTGGWLILTVPRRKRVSQAVTDEMASARTDIASENAAITSPLSHTSCHPVATPSRCFASTPRGRAAARLMTPEGVIADQKARPHVGAAPATSAIRSTTPRSVDSVKIVPLRRVTSSHTKGKPAGRSRSLGWYGARTAARLFKLPCTRE